MASISQMKSARWREGEQGHRQGADELMARATPRGMRAMAEIEEQVHGPKRQAVGDGAQQVRRSRGARQMRNTRERRRGRTPAGTGSCLRPEQGKQGFGQGGAEGDRQHGEQDGQKRGEGIGIGLHGVHTEQDDGQ